MPLLEPKLERGGIWSRFHLPPALWALAICTFGVGTGEYVVAGLLLNVSGDLKVSISNAGHLVSGYALGVVVGAPLMLALARLPRKATLLTLIGVFIAGNVLCAIAPNYNTLMAARVLTGLCHAPLFGLGSVIAAEVVSKERRASAIAVMFTGVTLANVLGVPAGTLLGQRYGWRTTFWAIAMLCVLAIISVARLVPNVQQDAPSNISQELRVIRRPQVVLAFSMTMFGFGSIAMVLTYIAPILVKISGFSQHAVSPILLLFGMGFVLGNSLGGKLADRRLMVSLMATLASLATVLAAFTLTSHNQPAAIVTVFLFGVTAFGIVPGFQLRVVSQSADGPNLASAINIAAFNLGSAGGALLGGIVLDSPLGLNAVPWVGALVALTSLVVAASSWVLERRETEEGSTHRQEAAKLS